jgi:hypothetical protein
MQPSVASEPRQKFRPAPGVNRWTFEPLLFVLPWIFAGTLTLSFLFLAYAGTGWDVAGAVAIFVTLWVGVAIVWAWLRRAMRARSARQSP